MDGNWLCGRGRSYFCTFNINNFMATRNKMDIKLKGFVIGFILGVLVVSLVMGGITFIILWQLGPEPAPHPVNRCTGFSKIKCFDRSVILLAETDTLNATFVNVAGTPVTITSVTVGDDCIAGTGRFSETTLAGGEVATFSCTASDKNAGDTFSVTVNITYTELVAGKPLTHTDTGRITGTAE